MRRSPDQRTGRCQAIRGFSRLGLLIALGCAAVLVAIVIVVSGRSRDDSRWERDGANVKAIIDGWMTFAASNDGRFPAPGDVLGQTGDQLTHRAQPDAASPLNTTASMYALTIAQRLAPPTALLSPVERNPAVTLYDPAAGDGAKAYQPAAGRYWDWNFVADLETGSNVSYAHMPIAGRRMTKWRLDRDPNWVLVGGRGPKDGVPDAASLTMRPDGSFQAHIAFGDGRVEMIESCVWKSPFLDAVGSFIPDNLYRDEPPNASFGGLDRLLTFTRSIVNLEPVVQWD